MSSSALSFRFEGVDKWTAWLNRVPSVLSNAQTQMLQQAVQEGVQYIQSITPVDTGYMRAHVSGNVTGTGQAEIRSSAYYSGFVNFGTRFMDAQPFFSDGIAYIEDRIKQIIQDIVFASLKEGGSGGAWFTGGGSRWR